MSRRIRAAGVALAFLAVLESRCAPDEQSTSADGTLDATTDSDSADADAAPEPKIPCAKVIAAWKDFVEQHRSCATKEDCVLVGGADNWCTCGYAIGQAGGDPISAGALSDAEPFLESFGICRSANFPFGCFNDHGPATNLRCELGLCTADMQFCGPPEAAPPDADLDSPAEGDAAGDATTGDAAVE